MRASLLCIRRALGVAELAGRDGLVNGPGCRTVAADRQRLLDRRGPSIEFAPMREVGFAGEKELERVNNIINPTTKGYSVVREFLRSR